MLWAWISLRVSGVSCLDQDRGLSQEGHTSGTLVAAHPLIKSVKVSTSHLAVDLIGQPPGDDLFPQLIALDLRPDTLAQTVVTPEAQSEVDCFSQRPESGQQLQREVP